MHPIKPKLNGLDMLPKADPNGVYLFQDMVSHLNGSGEGYVAYAWPRPGDSEAVDKLSFIKGFPAWGWGVGTGVYVDDIDAVFIQSALKLGGVSLVFLLLAGGISMLILRTLLSQIQELLAVMRGIQDTGDLNLQVRLQGADELASIGQAFNAMLKQFRSVLQHVQQSVDSQSATSDELATVTVQTSEGMDRQRRESEMLATAMSEMTATAQEVAASAGQAAEAAANANSATAEGNRVVQDTISTINQAASNVDETSRVISELESDAENIGSILAVIRDIADQTNLLALNAAIEAARAGEQGRGFAVVADEVRTLASRTQDSTAEIQTMISTLQQRSRDAVSAMMRGKELVESGVQKTAEAGESLNTINEAVNMINSMNVQIASAAEEQTSVSEEMSRGIVTISQVAAETADGGAQVRHASENLMQMTAQTRELLKQFKV